MAFTSAKTVPYYPSQCPKCQLLVDDDRCKGFVTKDPFGDMLGTFQGESDGPCPKFIPAEPSVDRLEQDQQGENASKVNCAKCRQNFDWSDAYKQQDTPGSSAYNPPGQGEWRPRAFCPQCGYLVAEWDIDQTEDRDRWKWYGPNEILNVGKELPPSAIVFWGKPVPTRLQVPISDDQIDLSKMTAGVSNDNFLEAAASGDVAAVKELISAGADLNTKSYKGETAAMMAASEGHTEVVKLLIEEGVDINDQKVYGQHTPLILAALNGHPATVKALLEAGADPDLKNQFGNTAREAAKNAGHLDIVDFFITADISEREEENLAVFDDSYCNPVSQPKTVSIEYNRKVLYGAFFISAMLVFSGIMVFVENNSYPMAIILILTGISLFICGIKYQNSKRFGAILLSLVGVFFLLGLIQNISNFLRGAGSSLLFTIVVFAVVCGVCFLKAKQMWHP